MGRYAALLRGINVGGKNLIKMSELKACLDSGESSSARLAQRIETLLAARFSYRASVVLRTRKQLRSIVDQAPEGFGAQPARYRYDVLFLKPPLRAAVAIERVPTRAGVDQAYAGSSVLYFSRLISRASQSRLSRIVSMPIYQSMTIRNWNTTTKLLQMMEAS